MKLIDREPTQELRQKPIAFEYHGRFSFAHIHQDERFLYTFPHDAQAEISRLNARIKELEQRLEESACGFKRDLVKQLQDSRKARQKQAAELFRLKAVIAKCHSALSQCKQWQEGANTLTCHNHDAVEGALASIKEIEK